MKIRESECKFLVKQIFLMGDKMGDNLVFCRGKKLIVKLLGDFFFFLTHSLTVRLEATRRRKNEDDDDEKYIREET